MVRIAFAKDVKSVQNLLLIAPARLLTERRLPDVVPTAARRAVLRIAKDLSPGLNGATGASYTDAKPSWVAVGALPNEVSRYNSAARPEPIVRAIQSSSIAAKDKAGVLVLLDDAAHVLPAANAIGRALPLFSARSSKTKAARLTVAFADAKGKSLSVSSHVKNVVEFARDSGRLVDSPPTAMNPAALAKEAHRALNKVAGVRTSTIVGKDLVSKRLMGIHSVGRTAVEAPRMFVARYRPKKKSKWHVALVGKGVTFDTGGLHIKGRGSMESMKSDMGGAAAVLGAFRALAAAKVKHEVSLILCLAENAVGPASYKPDDIITMHSKKTVEINNTDAEGRLLLGDGVSWAARELQATHVFDAATLTGAQLISTGLMHAAVMSNDAALERAFVEAGQSSGDLVHPLPFAPEFFKSEFSSQIADMKNSVKNRANAQSSCAAQFVYNHLEGTDVKWVHVDLAGPSFRGERGTGYGVALLSEVVKNLR